MARAAAAVRDAGACERKRRAAAPRHDRVIEDARGARIDVGLEFSHARRVFAQWRKGGRPDSREWVAWRPPP